MSESSVQDVHFGVQPGWISAFYFVLFDLVLLALLDIVLSRMVCYMYYRRIQRGIPVDVRSTDIPGVSTFLVGKIWALPNVIALTIKFGFLACILLIDLKIDAQTFSPREEKSTNAVFIFDPSDTQWNKETENRVVTRRWEKARNCRRVDEALSNITYYAISFSLRDGVDLESEIREEPNQEYIEIDDRTIHCLREGDVEKEDEYPLVNVIGCSQELGETLCSQNKKITKSSSWVPLGKDATGMSFVEEGTGQISFALFNMDKDMAKETFPEYFEPDVFCVATQFGVIEPRVTKYACVLVSKLANKTTVIERWQYDFATREFWREFPGPVFESHINIGQFQKINLLRNIIRLPNWVGLSSIIVADSAVYKQKPLKFTTVGEEKVFTKVPVFAIVLGSCMVVAAIASRIIVAFTIGRDERPQINSIDGLSSIAREECEPTGRSYYGGRGMMIGLSHRNGRRLHFGPLRKRDESVPREAGMTIE